MILIAVHPALVAAPGHACRSPPRWRRPSLSTPCPRARHGLELRADRPNVEEEARLVVARTPLDAPGEQVRQRRHLNDPRREIEARHECPLVRLSGDVPEKARPRIEGRRR